MADRTTTAWPGARSTSGHGSPRLVVVDPPPDCRPCASVPRVDEARPRHARVELASCRRPGATARRAIVEHCRGRVPDDLIDDLRLIVSELVANVLEHGDGVEGLTLDLTVREREVDVQVTGHGDRRQLPPSDEWCLPPPPQSSGRGLGLVRRLARWVAVDGDDAVRERDGWVAVTASLPIT